MKKVFLLLSFFCPSLFAESFGSSSAIFLSEYPTAKGFSMSGISLPINDVGAVYTNPAIGGRIKKNEVACSLWEGVDGVGNYGFLGFSYRTENYGGFNLVYFSYSSGEEEIYDISGNLTKMVLEKDYILALGWGIKVSDSLFLGFKAKEIKSILAEKYSAKTFAFDIGSVFKIDREMDFGISIDNIGGKLKYLNESESVVRNLRIEVSNAQKTGAGIFLLGVGIKKESFQENVDLMSGMEFAFKNLPLSLRGGIKKEENFKFTTGIGFSIKDVIFDYGIEMPQKLGNNIYRFTLSFTFGYKKKERDKEDERQFKEKKMWKW